MIIDETLYDQEASNWVGADKKNNIEGGPSSWGIYGAILNRVNISQDVETGFVSLTVEHFSPYVAKKWVDLLVLSINEHIQLHDRKEALSSIEYLKEQIGKTSITEMRTIFYQLIEEQTKTLMLAEISREYVLKTLSPARVAEVRAKPKRASIIALGAVLGCMFAFAIVAIRYLVRRFNRP